MGREFYPYAMLLKIITLKELCTMKELDLYAFIALIIVLVGGICWGLVGLFNIYLITGIFGNLLGRLLYIIVGVAAGYLAYLVYLEKFKKT